MLPAHFCRQFLELSPILRYNASCDLSLGRHNRRKKLFFWCNALSQIYIIMELMKMLNWLYFPKNQPCDDTSACVIKVFESMIGQIDSVTHPIASNDVLAILRPGLESNGFRVEKSKRAEDIVSVPVLFGLNGRVEKAFEADAYHAAAKYVIEVEAGRAVLNYQFLKDFFEACMMQNVDYLCIAVRNLYQQSHDFQRVCTFFESLYASNRIIHPLKGILLLGY